jgi:hypothetical protein
LKRNKTPENNPVNAIEKFNGMEKSLRFNDQGQNMIHSEIPARILPQTKLIFSQPCTPELKE